MTDKLPSRQQLKSLPHHLKSVNLNTENQLPKPEGKHCCGLEQTQTADAAQRRTTGSVCRSTNKNCHFISSCWFRLLLEVPKALISNV